MIGYCKLCEHAGSIHKKFYVCRACWEDKEIRASLRGGALEIEDPADGVPLPDEPTSAAPGTPEKMLVMENRAKAKQQTCHPCDSRYTGDRLPWKFLAMSEQDRADLIESKLEERYQKFGKVFGIHA